MSTQSSSSPLATVLILGATSDIGLAVAHAFAKEGHSLYLAARSSDRLTKDCEDIRIRYGVDVSHHDFDVLDIDGHAAFLDSLPNLPEITVCMVGMLGKQADDEKDLENATRVMRSNYEGPAAILGEVANRYEALGKGAIIGVSSVAGDRGRASNYIYGSAKAGFTAFLSGLRNRLAKSKISVLTVKPGFVDTKMTADLDLPQALTAQPQEVADAIYRGWKKGSDEIYVRRIWCLIMMIIRNIPEMIFKKLSI